MRKAITVTLLLIVPLVLLGLAGASQALTLYDNFNTKPIDPAKWYGSERNFGPAAPNEETARKIAGGQFQVALTTYGLTNSNTGNAGTSNTQLNVINPTPITTMQADVTIKSTKVLGCTANTTSTRAGARVLGLYFNDGTSPGSGNRTGDIFAGIESRSDSIAGDHIVAFFGRCTNADCSTSTTSGFHTFTTVLTKGVANTLSVQWDQPNHQFIYKVNPSGPSPETFTFPYAFSDTTPPVLDLRFIGAETAAASCTSPAPRTFAIIKALFDNVMVNP